jgi:hypothetical protein
MTDTAYIAFVLSVSLLGGVIGIAGHFWRAHATYFPEDLGLGEPLNMLTRDDYIVEKYVADAEWDDAGYWDPDSLRNLIYYIVCGALGPLVAGAALWSERALLVTAACQGLTTLGLTPPLCP